MILQIRKFIKDDLEPLTEEELNEMDADTSDEDMKQIDEPEEETADITDTTDATETTDKTENTDKAETSDSSAKKSADKTKHQILEIQRNQKLKRKTEVTRGVAGIILRQPPDHISVIIRKNLVLQFVPIHKCFAFSRVVSAMLVSASL